MYGTFEYSSLSDQAFVMDQVMRLQKELPHVSLGQALRWGEVSGVLISSAFPIISSSSSLLGCPEGPVVAFFSISAKVPANAPCTSLTQHSSARKLPFQEPGLGRSSRSVAPPGLIDSFFYARHLSLRRIIVHPCSRQTLYHGL